MQQNLATSSLHRDFYNYFEFLSGQIHTVSFLDINSKSVLSGLGVFHGTVKDIEAKCLELNEAQVGYTLHACLNLTDLKGRKKKNIVSTRVLCVDIDREVRQEELNGYIEALNPHLIVETSPMKFHLYWRCNLPLADWLLAQAALAHKLRGDLNFSDLTRTARVPGILRVTKEGESFTPRICLGPIGGDAITDIDDSMRTAGLAGIEARREENKLRAVKVNKLITTNSQTGAIDAITARELGTIGSRNSGLYQVTKDFVIKGNGHLTEDAVFEFACGVNENFEQPLDIEEVRKTAASAFKSGEDFKEKRREKLKEVLDAAPKQAEGIEDYDFEEGILAVEKYSGTAIVERVVQRHGNKLVRVGSLLYGFDETEKVWLRQKPDTSVLYGLIKSVIHDTIHEEEFIRRYGTDRDGFSEIRLSQARCKYLSNGFIAGCVSALLMSDGIRRETPDKFDSKKGLFYCANGVLDLVAQEIRDAAPEDYLLQRSRVAWLENSNGSQATEDIEVGLNWWTRFLAEVFQDNPNPIEMVAFMQELFGYSLTGSIDEQKIFCHYGDGSNGKSKVLDALAYIAGGYTTRLSCSSLSKSKGAIQREFERMGAKLEGKRIVIMDDMDVATQWNEGVVKSLTSPMIPVRRLYEEEKDIPNRTKFHLGCNELPNVETENFGIIRRICIIRYNHQFEPDMEKEGEILAHIREYAPAILWWAVQGLARVLEKGRLTYPDEMFAEAQEYRKREFSLETACENLFEQADTPQELESLEDLTSDVVRYMQEEGIDKKINSMQVGRTLSEKFKYFSTRIWDQESKRKVMKYNLKLKAPRTNKLSSL